MIDELMSMVDKKSKQIDRKIVTELNDDICWQAVSERDSSFDGRFYFGVRSTGIYCRPGCASRQPRREQVAFFCQPTEAESAGFRACLRCRPKELTPRDPHVEIVERACRYIEEHRDETITLSELSERLGVSLYHFQRLFKRITGISPKQYQAACRADSFRNELKKGASITMAIYEAGYGSSSRLYENVPAQLGMTPSTYRKGGAGMQINYTVADSPLGRLLVATTARGICAVSLGESDEQLIAALSQEYPAAAIERNDVNLDGAIAAILGYLDGRQPAIELPLDLQATAFQWQVWQQLRAIPYGTTASYREIAAAIGRPSATRAVARACATNPVALVIPCHRVVRHDESLSGYRWGVERKARLLAQEKQAGK